MGQKHSHSGKAAEQHANQEHGHHSGDEDLVELDFELQAGSHRRHKGRRKRPLLGSSRAAPTTRERGLASGLDLGLCRALVAVPWRGLAITGRLLGATVSYTAAAGLCAFFPRPSKVVGLLSILSTRRMLGVTRSPRPVRCILRPVRVLSGPFLVYSCMWAVMPLALPGLWRALMYWQRGTPLVASYFVTRARVAKAQRLAAASGHPAVSTEELWQAQHEYAAERLFQILCELKGFYLKLGQILSAKTEMLPGPYTRSLSKLLDKMPATPFAQVQQGIEKELGGKLSSFFSYIDPFPLASATVAQVHQARLASGSDVVLKLQHPGTKRMMGADLRNLRLCCTALDALHVKLGFDLTSVVQEYCEQVPLEFDFEREARMAETIRATLLDHAQHFPLLRQVVVPRMLLYLSTPRLLTMEHMDGVPLLDIAGMDPDIKTQAMSALLLAYGIMILRAGVFHSDPHPGNLLACCNNATSSSEPDIKVAVLDFGQVKQLSDETRLRYALLVCALASREDELLVATMRELGLVVQNCSHEFEAIAGYILFDTRMDFPEAHESPLDPAANEGWRSARVPSLPQDLFMIVRVITLLRGIMHSLGVDISSSLMWRPLAMQTIAELSSQQARPAPTPGLDPNRQGSGQGSGQGLVPAAADCLGEQVHRKLQEQEAARTQAPEQRAELVANGVGTSGVPGTPRSGSVSPRCSWKQQPGGHQPQQSSRGYVSPAAEWRGSDSSQAQAAAELAGFLASQQQQQPGGRVQSVELL